MSAQENQNDSFLLFFDTFSHESSEDINLDLVQFPRPVLIHEIRVVPLGTKVTADVPGGVRLGATNPSNFSLELFVNNLNFTDAPSFNKLGELNYKENLDIVFETEAKLPTDGLILQGLYTTITLAVYGSLTTIARKCSPPPPPPPPTQTAPKPKSVVENTDQDCPSPITPAKLPSTSISRKVREWLQDTSEAHSADTDDGVKDLEQTGSSRHQPASHKAPDNDSIRLTSTSSLNDWSSHSVKDPRAAPAATSVKEGLPHSSDPVHARQPPLHSQSQAPAASPATGSHKETSLSDIDNFFKDVLTPRPGDNKVEGGHLNFAEPPVNFAQPNPIPVLSHGSGLLHPQAPHHVPTQIHPQGPPPPQTQEWLLTQPPPVVGGPLLPHPHHIPPTIPPNIEPHAPDFPRDIPLDHQGKLHDPRDAQICEPSDMFDNQRCAEFVPVSHHMSSVREPEFMADGMPDFSQPPPTSNIPNNEFNHMNENTNNLSDGEIPDPEGEGYEEISSDEDLLSDFNAASLGGGEQLDWESISADENWNLPICYFNPYQFEPSQLQTFGDPSLTNYEIEKNRLLLSPDENISASSSSHRLQKLIETFSNTDHHCQWVEAMEEVPTLLVNGLSYLVTKTDHKDILEKLVDWTFEGLDIDLAMSQPETAYKVRHLKMGIKMAGALCSCDSYVAFRMLSRNVQDKLLDLYMSDYMSSSVRLLIIRALDDTMRLKDGMDWFLGNHAFQQQSADINNHNGELVTDSTLLKKTGYCTLLKILTTKQMVRSMVALKALIKKIHVYEVLNELTSNVDSFTDMIMEKESIKPAGSSMVPGRGDDTDVYDSLSIPASWYEKIDTISSCLNDIAQVLAHADDLIAQPRRTLPGQTKFAISLKPYDPYPTLYHMFNSCHLLETVLVLLTTPVTNCQNSIFSPIRALLQMMIESHNGLLFLSAKHEVTSQIIRALTVASGSVEDTADEHPAHSIGMSITCHLRVLSLVDQLRTVLKDQAQLEEIDNSVVVTALNGLYAMTFTSIGREALSKVIVMDDNLENLIPFVTLKGEEEYDLRKKKSASLNYAIYVILIVVRYSNNVETLQKFAPQLLLLSDYEIAPGKIADKYAELADWILPFKQLPTVSIEQLDELVKLLRQYAEDTQDVLPKSLATLSHILQYLSIAPVRYSDAVEHTVELKYKYVLIELYSAGCFQHFITILQKISNQLLRTWQKGLPQNEAYMSAVLATISPIIRIVKEILSHLIAARGTEFHDLNCLSALFDIHTIMCSAAPSGLNNQCQEIESNIVDVLMAMTQPDVKNDGEKKDDSSKIAESLWTQMLMELFKYTMSAPYRFLSGLVLLSELLPLPLPLQTRESLSPDDVAKAIFARKLWSVHLYPVIETIQDLIHSLADSSCNPMQQLLRRICWQLSDLSPSIALNIMSKLLDTLLDGLDQTLDRHGPTTAPPAEGEVPPTRSEVRASGHTSRVLNLIAFLINQAPVKAAFLQLTRSVDSLNEKYVRVIPRMISLLNVVSEKSAHVQAQDSIISILQSLCDLEVTMITGDHPYTLSEQMSNSLPIREQTVSLVSGLLEHINNPDSSYSSISSSIRALILLVDHDYGFYHLNITLQQMPPVFYNLFTRINNTFDHDDQDCIAALSYATDLVQFMNSVPEPRSSVGGVPPGNGEETSSADDIPTGRTFFLSLQELKVMLGWSEEACAGGGHPLDDLATLLQEYVKEEESLKTIHENVDVLLQCLKTEKPDHKVLNEAKVKEPLLTEPEPLNKQFEMRAMFLVGEVEEERLTTGYWLTTPMGDESDQEPDMVKCDFEELREQFCQDFDLKGELSKKFASKDPSQLGRPKRRTRGIRKSIDTINTSRNRGKSNRFVAPMRGRGFGRGMSSSRYDSFRCRPPNTSRPPSMHVDDFMKIEDGNATGAGGALPGDVAPGGGAGGTNSGRIPEKGELSNRGRFERNRGGGPNRGSNWLSQTPPANFNRREGRGNKDNHGWGGGLNRGRGNAMASFKTNNVRTNNSPFGKNSNSPWNRGNRQNMPGLRGGPGPRNREELPMERWRDLEGPQRFDPVNQQPIPQHRPHWKVKEAERFLVHPHMLMQPQRRDGIRHSRSFTH